MSTRPLTNHFCIRITTIAGGSLTVNADAALGGTSGGVTFTGTATLGAGASTVSLAATRGITINGGVTATLDSNGNAFTVAGVVGADQSP